MNYTNTQIVALYDNDPQMTPDALAAAFGVEVESVKAVLSAGSIRYGQELQKAPEMFTSEDERIAAETIKRLCTCEIPGVALKAAIVLIDEKKGRRNPAKNAQKMGGININIFNGYLQKGKEKLKQLEDMDNAITI